MLAHRVAEGRQHVTMQLAGTVFDRSEFAHAQQRFQETLRASRSSALHTQRLLRLYCNQIYLSHGKYGFEAASEYVRQAGGQGFADQAAFGRNASRHVIPPSCTRSGRWRRRNIVLDRMARADKITQAQATRHCAALALHVEAPHNTWPPYSSRHIANIGRHIRTKQCKNADSAFYTTLNVRMQRAANKAIREDATITDRRHGGAANRENICAIIANARILRGRGTGTAESRNRRLRHGLGTAVDDKAAKIKVGPYRALLTQPDLHGPETAFA